MYPIYGGKYLSLIETDRTVYFFLNPSPLQFKICAIFQLSIDFGKSYLPSSNLVLKSGVRLIAIVAQRIYYGNKLPTATLLEEDDIEQALALTEE